LNLNWKKPKAEVGDLAKDLDDLILYAQFPVTGKKFLEWKYGITPAPDSVQPISLEEVKKKDEIIKKPRPENWSRKNPIFPPRAKPLEPSTSLSTKSFSASMWTRSAAPR
jgi:pyruvate carboxylase subunit B